MYQLSRRDYQDALRLIEQLEGLASDAEGFALASALALQRFLSAECAALAVTDRVGGACLLGALPASVALGSAAARAQAGEEYALALLLFSDQRTRVSIVLKRRGTAFSRHERERLALLRPHLAFLYRQSCRTSPPPQPLALAPVLTQREAQVMHWLAGGKTDADIATLLSISPRTVQKHLEHIYVKLGVETRTAAVMRAASGLATARSAA